MSDLTMMISSLGFPIVAAVGMFIYAVKRDKEAQEHEKEIITTLSQAHKEESEKLSSVIEKNTQAIEKTIAAVEKLSRRIDKISKEES